ncbi:MAG: response regulator, partial [Methylococcaceae bacterium]
SGKCALIVDDNATNRNILNHYLNSWGLTVREADNGTTALTELQTSLSHGISYDLIVLDRQMPVMDGLTLAKCLGQIPGLASIPIILLSSSHQVNLVDYQHTSIVEHLLKPARQAQLFDALVNALQGLSPKKIKQARTALDRPNYQDKKVLVVEDNKTNQKVIVAKLGKFNIVPELAENGQLALATLAEYEYDLIFMDCHMPVMDGYSATRELRLLETSLGLPHQTVIALTANALSDEREKCLVAGMDDYLSKPLVSSQLRALLAKYFDADSPQVLVNDTKVPVSRDPSVWNETTALMHLQDDKELLLEMIPLFLMESATQLNELSHLYATGDLSALADTAHALKGGAALFYAAPVVACAQRLEDSARSGQSADYQSLIDTLDKETTTLINTLQAYAQQQFS